MFLGFLLGASLFTLLFLQNLRRARLRPVSELVPNCLMTRYPIVFVSGPRSLFYFKAYWNQIPHFLASHGFETFNLSLPWKNQRLRTTHLKRFLEEQSAMGNRLHLCIDSGSYVEIESLLQRDEYSCLASVTHFRNAKTLAVGYKGLKGLPVPIEDVELPELNKSSVDWKMHLLVRPHLLEMELQPLGLDISSSLKESLLERTKLLAERDMN